MSVRGLVIGHVRDSTIMHVLAVAQRAAADVLFVDMAEYLECGSITNATSNEAVLKLGACSYQLDAFAYIYQRSYIGPDGTPSAQGRLLALEAALSSSKRRVINRPISGWQNMSKPFQTLMLQESGFDVPDSRSTSVPGDYREFRQRMGDVIYKSNSGQRSIVERATAEHDGRAERLVQCPVLFQRRIVGDDVRVHVLENEIFPMRIQSDAIDYRYYKSHGSFAKFDPQMRPPEEISSACVRFAAKSGVLLAGFDFKVDREGRWYCLEMNPTPAFESYDRLMDGIIARRIVEWMSGQ